MGQPGAEHGHHLRWLMLLLWLLRSQDDLPVCARKVCQKRARNDCRGLLSLQQEFSHLIELVEDGPGIVTIPQNQESRIAIPSACS